MSPAGEAPRPRVARLDGLRGLAVVAVVAYHYLADVGEQGTCGFLGVPVFFVLSGYLITRLLPRGGVGVADAYARFLARRLRRLGPSLVAVVVLGTPLFVLAGHQPWHDALLAAGLALTQLMAVFASLHPTYQSPLGPTWSLAVEWWFYLTWPLLLLGMRRFGVSTRAARNTALALAVVTVAVALPLPGAAFYFSPLPNLGVLLCGAALALHQQVRHERGRNASARDILPTGALALLLALLPLHSTTEGPGYRVLLLPATVLATVLLLDAPVDQQSFASRVLEVRWLRGLGTRAYSVYLWHLPVLWLTMQATAYRSGWATSAVSLAVTAVVVELAHRTLERPFTQPAGTTRSLALFSTTQPLPARVST
jgi:peptidoglycan/LPS O-acetylase OafA/YrhL